MTTPVPSVDLRPDHWAIVRNALRLHVPDREVLAFGSRATWTAKDYSDLDLAVMGEEPLSLRIASALDEALGDSDLPFKVDVVDWARIDDGFRRIIRRHGVAVQAPNLSSGAAGHARPRSTANVAKADARHDLKERSADLFSPAFPKRWLRRPLYSMATWVNGLAFRKIQFSQVGRPIIKIAELKRGISGQTKFTEQRFDDSVCIRPGDLLFSWSGSPETSIDAFWWRGPEGWLNQHVFRVTPKPGLDTTFFYYLLRYLKPNFIGIARNKQTTGLGHVTKRDLKSLRVARPDLSEQRAIAHVLGTLDDKIELNRRMNETLEAMARALFKSWFVEFDPVRARMEGWNPGLSRDIADLFPDRLVDSELGEMPEGWTAGFLGDVAGLRRGGVDPTEVASDMPYVGLEHMPRRSIALGDWGGAGSVSSRKSTFNAGDILFGKLRPYFHKVGVAPVAGICSTDIVVLQARLPMWHPFVLACVSSSKFVAYTSQSSTGTKMPRTNWKTMSAYELCRPSDALAAEFRYLVSPMLERLVANVHESRTLAALRDTLLPKLISGEVRVPDAERVVAFVA